MMDDIQNENLISPKIDNAFEINGADQLVVDPCLPGRFLFGRMYSAGRSISKCVNCQIRIRKAGCPPYLFVLPEIIDKFSLVVAKTNLTYCNPSITVMSCIL